MIISSIVLVSCDKQSEYKAGYIVDKRIDTVEIQGKYVPDNTYGIEFYIVYQEDKTMNRYDIKVTREKYSKAIISTDTIVNFFYSNIIYE
jgi:hypothetical protein